MSARMWHIQTEPAPMVRLAHGVLASAHPRSQFNRVGPLLSALRKKRIIMQMQPAGHCSRNSPQLSQASCASRPLPHPTSHMPHRQAKVPNWATAACERDGHISMTPRAWHAGHQQKARDMLSSLNTIASSTAAWWADVARMEHSLRTRSLVDLFLINGAQMTPAQPPRATDSSTIRHMHAIQHIARHQRAPDCRCIRWHQLTPALLSVSHHIVLLMPHGPQHSRAGPPRAAAALPRTQASDIARPAARAPPKNSAQM